MQNTPSIYIIIKNTLGSFRFPRISSPKNLIPKFFEKEKFLSQKFAHKIFRTKELKIKLFALICIIKNGLFFIKGAEAREVSLFVESKCLTRVQLQPL